MMFRQIGGVQTEPLMLQFGTCVAHQSGASFPNDLCGATDSSFENRVVCLGGLECLIDIIRALRMGSCLSVESRSPVPGSSPTSSRGMRKTMSSKKRSASRTSSFDFRREERLRRIPGRMFLNGASDTASLFSQQGRKGTNQDAMIVWENFGSRPDTVFCGVFDGHGPFGHMVAKKVRDFLPLKLCAHWEANIHSEEILKAGSLNSENTPFVSVEDESRAPVSLEGMEKDSEIFDTLKESFTKAFKVMDRELKMHTNVDCFCSGSTAVTLIKQGSALVIGNVGDSRAVLGTRDKDDFLHAVQLTVDLKPNLPGEEERIRKCRGRVFALRDEPDVARVWLPNSDSPGLAMARAFGDFCLKDFGLISVPDISYRRLSNNDEFIVLATDGVWDVLSNREVVNIIAASSARSSAARSVVEYAVRAWRYKYPTSKMDDCAVVCLFLEGSLLISSERSEIPEVVKIEEAGSLERSGTIRTAGDMNRKDNEVSRMNTVLNLPRFKKGRGERIMDDDPL